MQLFCLPWYNLNQCEKIRIYFFNNSLRSYGSQIKRRTPLLYRPQVELCEHVTHTSPNPDAISADTHPNFIHLFKIPLITSATYKTAGSCSLATTNTTYSIPKHYGHVGGTSVRHRRLSITMVLKHFSMGD